MNCLYSLVLKAAVFTYGGLICVIASRPAFRLDDDGHVSLTVAGDASHAPHDHAPGAEPTLLPRSCDKSGVIQLEASVVYRTCPGHPGCDKQDVNHTIARSCHTLRGADGARIEISSVGISWSGAAKLLGPLLVTMAASVESMGRSSIWSAANITVSSQTGPVVFEGIKGISGGAAIRSYASIVLSGSSSIKFFNVTAQKCGALCADEIHVFAEDVAFEDTQGSSGGAMCANKVFLKSDGRVTFRNSSAVRLYGGAVVAREKLEVGGKGLFQFTGCTSVTDGGAVLSKTDAIFALQPPGAMRFERCRAGRRGGAIASYRGIYLPSGNFMFDHCLAAGGTAMAAPYGVVNISEETNATYSGGSTAEVVLGSSLVLPVGGTIKAQDVVALGDTILAAKSRSQGDNDCPAGAQFLFDPYGNRVPGQCTYCPPGTASLAPIRADETGQVREVTNRTRLVLVRRGSPSSLHLPEELVPILRFAMFCSKHPTEAACQQLQSALAPQPLAFREFPRWAVTPLPLSRALCKNQSDWGICMAGFPYGWEALGFVRSTEAKDVSYDGARFKFGGSCMSAPFMHTEEGSVLYTLPSCNQEQPWGNASLSTIFEVDEDGSVHLAWEPSVALGVSGGPRTMYKETCRVCREFSPHAEVDCNGGTHLSIKEGFMLKHEPRRPNISLYQCPNKLACPFGHFSLTAQGQQQSLSPVCADGYDDQQLGCAQCLPGFGRSQLDPFKCERCMAINTVQRAVIKLSMGGFFYAMALRAAKPKTESQQVFKIFLSFATIASRCTSAIKYARNYDKLVKLQGVIVQGLRGLVEAVGIALNEGAGGDHLSVDCLRLSEGQASLKLGMTVDFSVPLVLLVCTYFAKASFSNGSMSLKELVVWATVFLPALFGSVAKCFPCVKMNEGGEKFLMYEIYQNTMCATSFIEWFRQPRLWMAMLCAGCLISVGPLLWLNLTADHNLEKHRDATGFLIAGYRPEVRWWEAVVLLRKAAIFTVAVLIPLSFAPGANIMALLLIVVLAEMLHARIKPYEDSRFNTLEAEVLGISAACLTLVAFLMVDWPFISPTVSLINMLVLIVLMLGTCLYLLVTFISAFYRSELEEPVAGSGSTEAAASSTADSQQSVDEKEDGAEQMNAENNMG